MVPRLQVSKVAGRLIMHLRYRGDEKHVKAVGLRKCFLTGGNSTLRQHCRQHYEIYKEMCEKDNVPLNHHAIPPQIAKTMNGKKQKRIDEMLEKGLPRPEVFMKDASCTALCSSLLVMTKCWPLQIPFISGTA
jgi:hypothetical protein